MTLPAILFGIILSTVYGAAFHVWKDGGIGKLFLFLVLGWAGFWAGHLVGGMIGWKFAMMGPLNVGMATLGSLAFLLVGEWLSRVEVSRK